MFNAGLHISLTATHQVSKTSCDLDAAVHFLYLLMPFGWLNDASKGAEPVAVQRQLEED